MLELSSLTFFGADAQSNPPSTVTLIVGPNGSGKSLALREIEMWSRGSDEPRRVVEDLDVGWPETVEAAEAMMKPFRADPGTSQPPPTDAFFVQAFRPNGPSENRWIHRQALRGDLESGRAGSYVRDNLLAPFTIRLDGRTRFSLVDPQPVQDLQGPPQNHIAALFKNSKARHRVRTVVSDAFPGRYFVIDPTAMSQFRVQLSPRPPSDDAEECNLDERAINFHREALPADAFSDGEACFVGLIMATMSLPHSLLLVDEPEAFLHPPLSRRLGANLAALAEERSTNLVAATHSAEFLMGCIASGVPTTIVRLAREKNEASAKLLAPTDLREVVRDPLLRSTGALGGLFHRGVVVGEADADRALYEEVNRRLVAAGRGASETMFTNTQNWQTIARVLTPLRKLGVPAAGVLDFDTLARPKSEWKRLYRSMNASELELETIEATRQSVRKKMKSHMKAAKSRGVMGLPTADRPEARTLLGLLADVGIFIVPGGELESWLRPLGASRGDKAKWIAQVFSGLGSNPAAQSYVHPGSGDVWAFVDRIGRWISDPKRRGM